MPPPNLTPEHLDLLTKLILGAYALAAGAFMWAWILYKWAVAYIKESIVRRVDVLEQNHIHQLEERVDRLEQRVGQEFGE